MASSFGRLPGEREMQLSHPLPSTTDGVCHENAQSIGFNADGVSRFCSLSDAGESLRARPPAAFLVYYSLA